MIETFPIRCTICHIPVSYTHLDVYKRQHYEVYIAKLCTRTLKDDAGNTYSYVDEEMRNRLQVDVYKRQGKNRREERFCWIKHLNL